MSKDTKEVKEEAQKFMEGEQLDAQTVIAVQRNRIMELEDNLTQALSLANQYKIKYVTLLATQENVTTEVEDIKAEGTE